VRVEIDLAPPPTSILDSQSSPTEEEAERDVNEVPINALDEDLTPVEALEAQALASAREEVLEEQSRPRRRREGVRRTFGDGPPMPEYFDQAVRSLDPPIVPDLAGVEEDIRDSIKTVEETLLSFKVDARVTDVKRGPVITRYEVQPASGVRVAAIANLDRDLARALAAHAVRIEAPVPGKNVVGIEIPNRKVHLVRLRDVLELPDFLSAPSKLSFVLGKDIAGQPKWADLTKMPHMLVAGATNSGKSVCLNTIITSIICRAAPDEVKFSLIDPKRVELTLYRDIPHLYHPVVVEPKDAVKVLRGMIVEMDRRYKKFAEVGVRNIASYNAKLDPDDAPLPYIVIVIDELADLMMTAAAEFEKLICRLAQLARATGIHLIVATQRPSVNVITGVIKANIPARVAFAVASQVDSRTILDAVGAERLIGSGDMLFDANNGGKAVRIQGAYLSEEEVNRIVDVVKDAYKDEPRSYGLDLSTLEDAADEAEERSSTSRAMSEDRRDDMYDEVRDFIIRHQEMSASMIQRKFEIGFPRAARIVDQFERDGLLGPADGPKPRKVLGNGAG
jgi:S-DNA-T family DNA segregation ATPase FtsK/SpoIIIE